MPRIVANTAGEQILLSAAQCDTIQNLVVQGSGGRFDMTVMHDLCGLGLAEVDAATRRLRLTADGEEVYRQLDKVTP